MSFLIKTDAGSSDHIIRQLWESDSLESLKKEEANQYSRYHPAGYGTQVREFKVLENGNHQCYFSRGTSCD